ncbi:MAG: polyribonucleotide nucleotidyltransferase [Candidatus Sungbacteria bacterium RIFCSPHIGHO2_02_FULL_49_12]|uniref:Polyribonucleotide nucleotidyltransferase n=1 Tax=Candidatus Sungbacteria bacterium RIFCSPHIGHO2_02_FULL_49_12 TaxID=1802271 RepID=A0A1G2KR98_9BACT|nr:MAG: polyribonucleotide nucleotidyltransferase [Candidatus Sungbacteria bacterium RIFCSPHIGHO2_02_FULL_49_12]
MKTSKYSLTIGGRELTAELGRFAHHANGVAVRYGDTLVLAISVMSPTLREGGDFFPLTCDYEEKFYAAGRISGSRFMKREGRPTDEAILSTRLIDRTIRPRFDPRMRNETQVVTTVMAFDGKNDPDIPALVGASLSLAISDIPWNGPVAGIRIGKKNGKLIVNPTYEERAGAELDLLISGPEGKINMIEAGAKEIQESDVVEAMELAEKEIHELIQFQKKIIAEHKKPKVIVPLAQPSEEMIEFMKENFETRLEEVMFAAMPKQEKYAARALLEQEWKGLATEKFGETATTNTIEHVFHEAVNEVVHRRALEKSERVDGRHIDELRQLSAEVGILPRVHGTGMFQRGETQLLSIITLGAPSDEQFLDTMEGEFKKRFMHHYNHPKYSTGEVGRMGGGGRREIGHGALAERALEALIPSREEFPYTIRVVSETLTSNGSTSMASVTAASLALMDAGVPITKHATGIAMGLMMDNKGHYKILTDIQGPEDHHGDMDFKVAGTRDGIVALQMDVKVEGIGVPILKEAMEQAKRARFQILDVMEETIAAPRPTLSPNAPQITTLKINPDKIRDLIGPGGKMINQIIDSTGAQIDVEDDGSIFVTAKDAASSAEAIEWIKKITREIIPGEILEGPVTRIFEFGAMVEVAPKQDGLIHISELAPYRVERVTDIVNIGDIVPVKVKNIDEQGRINLSLKDVPGRYSEEQVAQYQAAHPYPAGGMRPHRGGAPTYNRDDRARRGPRRF